MKIVFFTTSTLNYGGGCEKNFMNLGNWLSKKGHDIYFITATKKMNDIWCKLSMQGEHKKNLNDKELKKIFKINK